MKLINPKILSRDIHFPVVRAIPIEKTSGMFRQLFKFFTFRRKWEVIADYYLWIPLIHSWVYVPTGFIYDGASVPKILSNIFKPTGVLLLGALPHDFGYRYQSLLHVDSDGHMQYILYTKKELDAIFSHLCSYENGMKKASKIATNILRIFGSFSWKQRFKEGNDLSSDFPMAFTINGETDEN